MRKFAAPLCALCLSFQTVTHTLAEECDCAKHKATAAGPGACSLSESESWCQIAFRSMALQEIVVSALGRERAEAVFQNVPDVYADFNDIENAYSAISWVLFRDQRGGEARVGDVTEKQFVDTTFLLAAVPGAFSDPEKSDSVLLRFAQSVFAVIASPDDPSVSQLSDEDYSKIFAEFTGGNDIALEKMPISLPEDFILYVARGCFEITTANGDIRSMVQAPGAPAAGTGWLATCSHAPCSSSRRWMHSSILAESRSTFALRRWR